MVGEPAEVGDDAAVCALVLDADEEEERARDERVIEHLQHRADTALRVQHEDAECHEAHVRDR